MRCLNMHMQMIILDIIQLHLTFFLFLSLTCILLIYTQSPGGEWPISSLGNSLLFRTELVLIQDYQVYVPRLSHRSIPLKSSQWLAQVLDSTALAHCEVGAWYVPLQVLIISFISWIKSCISMLYAPIHMLHISLSNIACMHGFHVHNL